VLNAKNDEREASIVADAGKLGAVTISTNMAGRGTDIRLGGADECERDAVLALGGLHVIGTNRHESRRIDDQLRGRAGRQGDPGSSRSFASLEDDLVQRFAIESLLVLPPEHPRTAREVARAQRIVEGQNFEIRKTLYRYSVVFDDQRRLVQGWRDAVLEGEAEHRFLARECPELHDDARRRLGAEAVDAIEDQIVLRALDQCWSEHLDRLTDIRRGIHLVQLAGKAPFDAFLRQAATAFSEFVDTVEQESTRIFETLEFGPEGVDWERAGLRAPSSTWTYTINDDLVHSNLIRGLAYNPMILLGAAWMIPLLFAYGLWQRMRGRGRHRTDPESRE
ncbi:MAG: accessory Sec system translocase SecA2, partial [Myxococcota bacterium]